ncbi:MAG TPA: hypothetical protein VIA07_01210, partial [Desulfuromonadales bacterium]
MNERGHENLFTNLYVWIYMDVYIFIGEKKQAYSARHDEKGRDFSLPFSFIPIVATENYASDFSSVGISA